MLARRLSPSLLVWPLHHLALLQIREWGLDFPVWVVAVVAAAAAQNAAAAALAAAGVGNGVVATALI
jgi:hypothetical protein